MLFGAALISALAICAAGYGQAHAAGQRLALAAQNTGTLPRATALMVIASLDGTEHYMEWSNFGWFEELQMPVIGTGIRLVIFAGADGRWHLLY